jgi:hypothetical protein
MLVRFFAPLLGLLVAVTTSGIPALADPAPANESDTAAAAKLVQKLIAQIQTGKVDRSMLTPAFSEDLTDSVVASYAGFLNGRGKPKLAGLLQRNDLGDDVRYVYLINFDDGAVACTFGVDKSSNLVDALYFRPASPQPQS